jgi:hypothetical protein
VLLFHLISVVKLAPFVVTGSQLPPLSALFDPSHLRYPQQTIEPSSRLDKILRNPFSLVPISACAIIILISVIISPCAAHILVHGVISNKSKYRRSSHRTFDLLLAAAEATAMFHLAYPSCKSIGAVLLQTAPARGLSAGRMECFLRAMREVR